MLLQKIDFAHLGAAAWAILIHPKSTAPFPSTQNIMQANSAMTHKLEDAPTTNPSPAKRAKKEEAQEAKQEAKQEAQPERKTIEDAVEAITKQLLKLREHVLASTLRREHLSDMPDFATVALKLPKRVRGATPGPLLGNAIHQYFSSLHADAGALQFLDDDNNERLFMLSGAQWKDCVNGPLNDCKEAVDALLNGQPALALYLLITSYACGVPVAYCDVSRAIIGCMLRPELGLPQRARAMAQLVLLERACMLTSQKRYSRNEWVLAQFDQEAARDICVALLAFLTDGDFRPTGGCFATETSVHAYHMLCMRPVARRERDSDLFNHSISSELLIKFTKDVKDEAKAKDEDDDDDDKPRAEHLHVEGVCSDCTKCVSFLDYNVELMNARILKAKRVYAPALVD